MQTILDLPSTPSEIPFTIIAKANQQIMSNNHVLQFSDRTSHIFDGRGTIGATVKALCGRRFVSYDARTVDAPCCQSCIEVELARINRRAREIARGH